MKRLLVTGASGFLGWNICRMKQKEWEIFGTVFSNTIDIPGVDVVRVDLTSYTDMKETLHRIAPDTVIHTAAATQPNYCQMNRTASHRINVDASTNLAGLCSDWSIPFVFTSSDLVFDGRNPPYREEAPVCPLSIYGEQKVLAELGIIERNPAAIICRMPLMFGTPSPASESFIGPMARALQNGRELKLFTDEFRTPASGKAAVQGLFLALEKIRGIIHLGGIESMSRYELGLLLADVLRVPGAAVTPCLQKDVVMSAPRPCNVSLDSSRAFGFGYAPTPLRQELESLFCCHCSQEPENST